MKKSILIIEATISGAPCILIAMGGLPIFLFSGFSMLSYNPIEGLKGISVALGIALALFQYAHLAINTINEKIFHFGILFWLSVPFAILAERMAFGGFFSLGYSFIIVFPISFATFHFIYLQLRLRQTQKTGIT